MKFLQTKALTRKKSNKYALYHTIILNLSEVGENGGFMKIISRFIYKMNRDENRNSRKCDVCNIDVHGASLAERLKSKEADGKGNI